MEEEEENKWTLYFDGSKCLKGVGADILLMSPQCGIIPMMYKLSFECINNMVEYEALILGLKAYTHFNIENLQVYGESQLKSIKFIIQRMKIYNLKKS